ncbi:oxysterol-binding protein-related protein 1-like [Tropilaelaps mercedesae]|uniref:Oxysterol-binding protein n=1 Tax=Tropilaelaps mercedesae TaxID=418985 RepID=A0A1V9XK29_9ACAR|nr:oxysterol-binding protein-related protein 1-like [Tropilaelaps mercedesae]
MLKWLKGLFARLRPRLGWRRSTSSSGGRTSGSLRLEDCEFNSYSGTPWAGPSPVACSPQAVTRTPYVKNSTKWGRARLPHPQLEYRLSLWSILKKFCGKEFYRLAMPVEMNEPLSFLQRLTEILEYADLLEQAAAEDSSVNRMQCIAAFAVASLSSNLDRLRKPFNPLLGETFELDRSREESGCFRVVCEQVSHHPPVSALYAESGRGAYEMECSVNPRLIFWGKSIEIKPQGLTYLKLPKRGNEVYVWKSVDCRLQNILIGELYFEQHGEQTIHCQKTGLRCRIRYLQSESAEKMHKVEGEIVDCNGKIMSTLSGYWSKEIFFSEHNSEVLLWTAEPRPVDSRQYYNFTSMAMALNEMPIWYSHRRAPYDEHERMSLSQLEAISPAPTDSRFRLDIRRLEKGDIEAAAAEKGRLEEKQREARKARSNAGTEWRPMWFEKATEDHWMYRGGFWKRKNNVNLPDIF